MAAKLRPGNVQSAEGWEELLLQEIERQQQNGREMAFRNDAAFAKPVIYQALEERGVEYVIRLLANEDLERDIEELLTCPVGRPTQEPVVRYKGFLYQAASWRTARRVMAKAVLLAAAGRRASHAAVFWQHAMKAALPLPDG